MTETSKKIWTKLEENIGRCILFRDAALKEVLGNDTFMLQFATLSVPEKVEAFLDNAEEVSIIRREKNYYVFSWEGARVEIYCFDAESGFESSYEKMFSRPLRCENLGINIMGQYNRNVDAYNDIVAKELHFASGEAKITEFLVSKIVRYVLNFGFTIGEDILENASQNKIFDSKAMRVRFLSALSDNIKKTTCTWDRVAEVLKFIAELLPSPDFIQYTTALGDMEKEDKFVRNYLYNLFIILDMTGQELHKIIPKESTLEYFDSLAINIGACLGEYKTYIEIKNKYGDEFLELLMDVQESVAKSLHLDYQRVSDETFDMGEMFFKDDRFWCSLEEMNAPKEETAIAPASQVQEESMDVSKGNFVGWTKDEFDKEMYSEEGEAEAVSADKVYLDDEVETESVDTGIDMSALDSYETDVKEEEGDEPPQQKNEPPKQNDSIMNSQRGHESTVLNSGGV